MFEVLSQLVVRFMSKVFASSVEAASKTASQRRSLLTTFVELYETLVELEDASKSAHATFAEFVDGSSAPVIIVVRNRVERLVTAFSAFTKQLRAVETQLGIRDHELLLRLGSVGRGKRTNLVILDLLTEVTPAHADRHAITFATDLAVFDPPSASRRFKDREQAEKEMQRLKKSLQKKLKRKHVDLNNIAEARLALHTSENDIQNICDAREELARFIRKNLPLDSLLV